MSVVIEGEQVCGYITTQEQLQAHWESRMSDLTPIERTVFELNLSFGEDEQLLTQQQISTEVGRSVDEVRQIFDKARTRLAQDPTLIDKPALPF